MLVKRKKPLICLFLFGTITLGLLAGCRGETPSSRADIVIRRIDSELSLNDAQKKKLELIKTQWLESRTLEQPERKKTEDRLVAMVRSNQIDPSEMKAIISRRRETLNSSSDKLLALISDFHSSLTLKQKNKLADHIQGFFDKFDHE